MDKPMNPYRKGSLTWSIMEGDWEDLTVNQIAEVLDCDPDSVTVLISRIKAQTGYTVLYAKKPKRRRFVN